MDVMDSVGSEVRQHRAECGVRLDNYIQSIWSYLPTALQGLRCHIWSCSKWETSTMGGVWTKNIEILSFLL